MLDALQPLELVVEVRHDALPCGAELGLAALVELLRGAEHAVEVAVDLSAVELLLREDVHVRLELPVLRHGEAEDRLRVDQAVVDALGV